MNVRLILLSALFTPALALASPQLISCTLDHTGSTDHLRITLQDSQSGTFLYETAETTASGSSSPLKLKRILPGLTVEAHFEVESPEVKMIFKMPLSLLGQASTIFHGVLSSTIASMDLSQDQDLTCDSVLKL